MDGVMGFSGRRRGVVGGDNPLKPVSIGEPANTIGQMVKVPDHAPSQNGP